MLRVVVAMLVVILSACDSLPFGGNSADEHRLYGNVDVREVQLAFRIGGRIASLNVDEGAQVSPGEVLASLDDKPQALALAAARSVVAEREAALRGVRAGARPEQLAQLEARVREADAAFAMAVRTADRQQELAESRNTSPTAVDAAVAEREQRRAQLAVAKAVLALARAGSRREDIARAEAAVEVARAQVAQAQSAYDDTRLIAPSAGIVSVRAREPGSLVAVGQPVYVLSLSERVFVRAYVDEPRLALATPGATVAIHTDASEKRYRGHIGFVSPRAEFTPKTVETPELRTDLVYRLRIVVDDADQGLRQGMPVTVELQNEPQNT